MVSIGEAQACMVVDGLVRCWNDPNRAARDQLVISFEEPALEVALSYWDEKCVRLAGDTVRCWSGSYISETALPEDTHASPIGQVEQIALGFESACVVTKTSREVRCWGANDVNLLGPGVTSIVSFADAMSIPPLPFGKPIKRICMADLHACVVTADGNVVCWGDGRSGALGYGTTDSRGDAVTDFTTPVPFSGVHFEDVTCGARWTCARTSDGALRCWGSLLSHGNGRVYGDTESASVGPTVQLGGAVSLLGPASARAAHACVIVNGTGIRCWGDVGSSAALGQERDLAIGDDELPSIFPAVDIGLDVPVFVTTGGTGPGDSATSCAIGASGSLYCWGDRTALGYGHGNAIGGTPGSMPPGPVPFE